MEKFKVGDKVKVKKEVVSGQVFNDILVRDGMITSKKLTIDYFFTDDVVSCSNNYFYGVDALTKVK